ncbi:MAG: hypothetical protein CMC39_03625 [Flavobacteriaceae bacterium]|nr:hypothetical protein [Flavobacteriaceae bacterium]|tara:strand:+ start:264 stop:881 length:618 start_codon:yes stop_codon:yes gene_type:complete
MKKIITLISILILILKPLEIRSQDKDYPWQISFGANAVDIEADTNTSISEFFNVDGNWNVSKSPISMLSISKYVGENFSFGVGASFNSISKYATGLELSDITNDYFSIDAMLKYDLSELLAIKVLGTTFEPFVGIGPGWTSFSDQDGLTANFSLGVNYWLTETFGFVAMSEYKHNLDDIDEGLMLDEGGTMRWSLMFVIKFGKIE